MKIFNIPEKEIIKLKQFYPSEELLPNAIGIEKDFIYEVDHSTLIKTFYDRTDEYMTNKKEILTCLDEEKKLCPLDFLIYPDGLIEENNSCTGYLMKKVYGVPLFRLLSNPNIPFSKKKYYLWQIGMALEKMKEVREETEFSNFYLNDIHERNFVINEYGSVKCVDVDSMVIGSCDVAPSMYLRPASRLTDYKDKYHYAKKGCMGLQIEPTYDTEIYCYCMIILNMLLGEKIIYMKPDEFNTYLDYLESLGTNKELINTFRRLYTDKCNVNPYELVNLLEENPYTLRKHFVRSKTKRN